MFAFVGDGSLGRGVMGYGSRRMGWEVVRSGESTCIQV